MYSVSKKNEKSRYITYNGKVASDFVRYVLPLNICLKVSRKDIHNNITGLLSRWVIQFLEVFFVIVLNIKEYNKELTILFQEFTNRNTNDKDRKLE